MALGLCLRVLSWEDGRGLLRQFADTLWRSSGDEQKAYIVLYFPQWKASLCSLYDFDMHCYEQR